MASYKEVLELNNPNPLVQKMDNRNCTTSSTACGEVGSTITPRFPATPSPQVNWSRAARLVSCAAPLGPINGRRRRAAALFHFKTKHWRRERGLAVNLAGNTRAITRRTMAGRRVRPFVTSSVRRAAHHAIAINRILEIARNDFTSLRIVNP